MENEHETCIKVFTNILSKSSPKLDPELLPNTIRRNLFSTWHDNGSISAVGMVDTNTTTG